MSITLVFVPLVEAYDEGIGPPVVPQWKKTQKRSHQPCKKRPSSIKIEQLFNLQAHTPHIKPSPSTLKFSFFSRPSFS